MQIGMNLANYFIFYYCDDELVSWLASKAIFTNLPIKVY